ncbi:MAG: UDP-3-O-(3-hydroxymyristoyl)glucosamine N-acyltransferase [Abditibacteriota bacterium]|nr:UDP-3-O-(3-hydroxymyristoyl)glucosamine N-acyltransferase [Abditibacteriota bacterium]
MKYNVREFARKYSLEIAACGEEEDITGISYTDDAVKGDLVLADTDAYFDKAVKSGASFILAGPSCGDGGGKWVLRSADAGGVFVDILQDACPAPYEPDPSAPSVALSAVIGSGCVIAPTAHIGPDSVVGDGVRIYPGVYVGAGVTIGSGTVIMPNATIYDRCIIGKDNLLHAGCVIGADGFGFYTAGGGIRKYPHLGIVRTGDCVEVGANSTIDRAKLGETVIGDLCKIDNLVQVAHNVKLGAGCILCAQTGIAGSSTLGDLCVMGGNVGVSDHVHLGNRVYAGAKAGISRDFGDDTVLGGFPAMPMATRRRVEVLSARLPEMYQRLKDLEKELQSLKQ